MNRIETKIIITITNCLSKAKDSDAKTEMIEELSENLYQRYLELAENGMAEEEAFQKAMESLGDTEELLAYLEEEEAENGSCEEEASGKTSFHEGDAYEGEHTSSFKEDWESGIEEIVNTAFSTAKVAVDCARDVAKDVSDQLKERYPEGMFSRFTTHRGKKVDCTAIPMEYVRSLEIRLTNGSIDLCCGEEDNDFIEVSGDTEEIETMLKENGRLVISQGNTASAVYFFMRGMRRSDIEITLPRKMWDNLAVSTVNGDICVHGNLLCTEMQLSTVSGDVDLEGITCTKMTVSAASGDIVGSRLSGDLYGESKSGDVEIKGNTGRCELFSASGDVSFEGECRELNCSSTSGEVEFRLHNLPESIKGNTMSGDCRVCLPAEKGFHLTYRTVSGKFMTSMPFDGKMGEKSGDAVYLDGTCGEIQITSVSGDIEISAIEE